MSDPLSAFSPIVQAWFRATFGNPTPPQAQGWLPIQRGEHTLMLAPTGSGKTLAAFLWGVDELYQSLEQPQPEPEEPVKKTRGRKAVQEAATEGIHLLYISPLK